MSPCGTTRSSLIAYTGRVTHTHSKGLSVHATPRPLDLVPHRRYNPLLREWILVSPQRTQRPWQGETTKPTIAPALTYDPTCYLCPGNARSGGIHNPPYTS